MERVKSIHISRLGRGSVIALKLPHGDAFQPIVWYHVDYIDNKVIHLTAMHTNKSYERQIYDRFVWIRDFS